jgi:autotransporter passenger strand-loop-strand repeat protein
MVQMIVTVSSGQTLEVSSGQTSNGIIVLSGGTLQVDFGGTALGTVDSGGTDNVYGSANGTIVSSGGTETVESGGTAIDTVVSSGGSLVVASSGIADPTTIYSSGSETISAGGTDDGALISGGTQFDYGFASGVTVFAGSQVVDSGGTASSTTTSAFGVPNRQRPRHRRGRADLGRRAGRLWPRGKHHPHLLRSTVRVGFSVRTFWRYCQRDHDQFRG